MAEDGVPPLRVWVVVSTFPVLTTTFLVHRIRGLIASGLDVHVIAEHPGFEAQDVIDPGQRELMARVTWILPGRGRGRMHALLRHWPPLMLRRPRAAFGALNAGRYRNLVVGTLSAGLQTLRRLPPPDVVLACFGPMGVLACALRDLGAHRAPVVTSFHGVDAYGKPPERLRRRYRRLLSRGERVLPVSRHMAARLVEIGFDEQRIEVLHTPVDLARLPWRGPRTPPADGRLRILGVGRLVETKGFADGLRVVAALIRRGRNVRYRIIGDGPERPALEALADELGIADAVELTGFRTHDAVRRALGEADLLLATHRVAANGDRDGIPNAIKEAMATGLPVVATRHSGIPELVLHERTGLLAEEGAIDDLADACQRLLGDRALAVRLAEAGREHVAAAFDSAELNRSLVAVLRAAANA